jgi:hypothetical protein
MTEPVVTVADAVREAAELCSVVIAGAGQVPTGLDATFIRKTMLGLIAALPGFRNGEWCNVLLTSDAAYEAKDGERISPQGFNPVITLPATYTDDCGTVRIQEDMSRVHVIKDGFYLYAASLGEWNKTNDLAESDPFPFGSEDRPGLVALTAAAIGKQYGADLDPFQKMLADNFLKSWSARVYREVIVPADLGVLRLSNTGYNGVWL